MAVTPLGHILSHLPIDLNIGRMLVLGQVFGCVEEAATMAAAVSMHHDVFIQPFLGGGGGGKDKDDKGKDKGKKGQGRGGR